MDYVTEGTKASEYNERKTKSEQSKTKTNKQTSKRSIPEGVITKEVKEDSIARREDLLRFEGVQDKDEPLEQGHLEGNSFLGAHDSKNIGHNCLGDS